MKIIQIALTCVVLVAAQAGIAQPVPKSPPATATMPMGAPQMGSANDHEIQKLNMELTKVKAELAQESAKFKTELAALANQLSTLTAKYNSHTHDYVRASNDFYKTWAKCEDCNYKIVYDVYKPRYEKDHVSPPIN